MHTITLFKKKISQKKSPTKGFTLIELLVSSAIFVTAMTIALEALFAAQHSYAKIDGLRAVMDNLNTSFDLMTRDIRYGSIYYCGADGDIESANRSFRHDCPFTGNSSDGGTALMFKPANAVSSSVRIGYYLYKNKVYLYALDSTGATSTTPITGDDVMIDTLHFFVQGAHSTVAGNATASNAPEPDGHTNDNLQPVITIVIAGRAIMSTDKAKDSHFQLQTTVSPRHIDI